MRVKELVKVSSFFSFWGLFLSCQGLSTKLVAEAWSRIKSHDSFLLSGAKILRGDISQSEYQKAVAKYEAGSSNRKVVYSGMAVTFDLKQAELISKASRSYKNEPENRTF